MNDSNLLDDDTLHQVRYESRKKLAEQRPRIKGQFVRQVQSTETSTQEATQ